MLVHPSAVNSLVLVGSLGLGSAAAPKGRIRERRLLQKKDLLSSSGAPPFNAKNRRGDGRPGRKERRAKIAELESESSTEEIPAVDTGVIGHEAVAAPVASKLDVEFVDCVRGYVRDDFGGVTCEEACDGNCCVGYGACDYFTGRVAKDGSCDGNFECGHAQIGEVSGPSCVGGVSCYDAYAQSITNSSCTGLLACYNVLAQSITDSSCIGEDACSDAEIGEVSGQSCVGIDTCYYTHAQSITDSSCTGRHACYNSSVGVISGQSCDGESSCKKVLAQSITDSSCIGEIACLGSEIDDVISGKSCDKRLSCFYVYAKSITDSSCIGEQACRSLVSYYGETPNVSSGSCVGYRACYYAGFYGVLGPSISASCKGDDSCHYAGYSGSVGDLVDSCDSDSACKDMGKNGSVGNVMNGCNGKGTCQSVAEEETQSVSAIVDCCNAPPDGICAGVASNDGLVAADPTCKAGVVSLLPDILAAALALIEEESEGDTSPFTKKQMCYGKTAVENTVASLSKGHSTAAVRYGVNKAIDDLGCDDKSDSEICIFLNDALEILQL